ncbi:uncharacterized protein F5Z01DRAFT_692629 [Emericellopsis atlantica]|uniref:Uncharacterized protein n=1 Tax=Emericellopsis atlantica TaxID=2614577 RepID=A0A9P7ZFM1_9HYPO|nr:uncharacterized protein F5Z01DRAFT_692629 [Emericellopsis atlantica]KAG9251214.1 hypothetical protein F5Z01DRAFT_692629 [Emericellopsis atlantica]
MPRGLYDVSFAASGSEAARALASAKAKAKSKQSSSAPLTASSAGVEKPPSPKPSKQTSKEEPFARKQQRQSLPVQEYADPLAWQQFSNALPVGNKSLQYLPRDWGGPGVVQNHTLEAFGYNYSSASSTSSFIHHPTQPIADSHGQTYHFSGFPSNNEHLRMFYAQPPPPSVPPSLILRSNGPPRSSARFASGHHRHEPAPVVPSPPPSKQNNNIDMPPWLYPQSSKWFEKMSLDCARSVKLVPTGDPRTESSETMTKKRKRGAHGQSKSEPTGAETSSKRQAKMDGLFSTEGVLENFRWSPFGPDEMQQALLLDQVLHQPTTLDLELASYNTAFAPCDLTLGTSSCSPSSLGGDGNHGFTDHPLPGLLDSNSFMPGTASGPVSVFQDTPDMVSVPCPGYACPAIVDGQFLDNYSPGLGMTFDTVPPAPGIRPLESGPLDNMPHGDNGAQPAIEGIVSSVFRKEVRGIRQEGESGHASL